MAISTTSKVIFITTTTPGSITLTDFYTFTSIEAIGAGGGHTDTSGASAGGGGAYAKTVSVTGLTSATPIYYSVGAGVNQAAGLDSWVNVSANGIPVLSTEGVLAKAGGLGAGGSSASCVGSTTFSGGNGGTSVGTDGKGGGGGAAGPNGAGGNGGNGAFSNSGGGGGGANGGASANATTAIATATAGGNNRSASGGGTAGIGSGTAGAGSNGGGGGGNHGTNSFGGTGSSDNVFTSTHSWNGTTLSASVVSAGPGSGAGGARGNAPPQAQVYGAGASAHTVKALGAQGIVVISYNAADPATITSISPTNGADCGGTNVVITGTNFTDITSVTFGAASSSFTINSDTQITAVSPAGVDALNNYLSSGAVTLSVNTPRGNVSNTYTYNSTSKISDETAFSAAPQIGEVVYGLPADNTKLLADGYLAADGSIVSQSTYPDLAAILGTFRDGRLTTTTLALTAVTSGVPDAINKIVYDGSSTYVFAAKNGIRTSTDCITWTARTSGTASDIFALTYGNGLFVFGGQNGSLSTSTNAITWTARTSGITTPEIYSLAYGNGLYVFGDSVGGLRTSTDAITWTARTSGTTSTILNIVYGNGLYVFGTESGGISTSTDAITWTARTSGTAENINALIYANGLFIYGSADSNGLIGRSTNGTTWQTVAINDPIGALTYSSIEGTYVLGTRGGASSGFRYSFDAITWTAGNLTNIQDINDMVYNPTSNRYFSVGAGGQINYSELYTYNPTTQFRLPLITNPMANNLYGSINLYIKAK